MESLKNFNKRMIKQFRNHFVVSLNLKNEGFLKYFAQPRLIQIVIMDK